MHATLGTVRSEIEYLIDEICENFEINGYRARDRREAIKKRALNNICCRTFKRLSYINVVLLSNRMKRMQSICEEARKTEELYGAYFVDDFADNSLNDDIL